MSVTKSHCIQSVCKYISEWICMYCSLYIIFIWLNSATLIHTYPYVRNCAGFFVRQTRSTLFSLRNVAGKNWFYFGCFFAVVVAYSNTQFNFEFCLENVFVLFSLCSPTLFNARDLHSNRLIHFFSLPKCCRCCCRVFI